MTRVLDIGLVLTWAQTVGSGLRPSHLISPLGVQDNLMVVMQLTSTTSEAMVSWHGLTITTTGSIQLDSLLNGQ